MAVRLHGLTTARDTTGHGIRPYHVLLEMFENVGSPERDADVEEGYTNYTVADNLEQYSESSSDISLGSFVNNIIEDGAKDDEGSMDFLNPHSIPARAVFITLYTIIAIMSLLGNSLVCLVVVRNKRMRSVTNFFLANQALSDMLMTILNIPFIAYNQLAGNWPFGFLMCHLADYMGMSSVYVSTFMLTAIALDRHSVIIHPLRPRITMRTAIAIAVLIWVLAMSLSIPFAIYRELQERPSNKDHVLCLANYPGEDHNFTKYFTLATFIYQCVVPLALTSGAYLHIGMKLWAQASIGDVIAQQRAANNQTKHRTTRMLVLVVAVFALCWCPINVYLLVSNFWPDKKSSILYLSLHWFAMCSVCINPVAFAFLNKNFRSNLKASFHCWFKNASLKSRHSKSFGRTTDLNENSHTADRPTNGQTRYEYVTTRTGGSAGTSCNGSPGATCETYQLEVKLSCPDELADEIVENKV
ncbi:probable G-protein coupled receptor 83 [Patiria miniata]|uniref:G-protein coupled receptors family 1 profile domain-containing protein n=1 Tax=Patiria miniata TaxID=46514 RepID=A0A914B5H9_PATMI|nr:probable G-protein coupled receptor 83 [Patiria miniata]